MSLRVVVVGCGPAGMSAAVEAQRRGATVTLIDEAPRPGGQIFRQSAIDPSHKVGLGGELKRKAALLQRFNAVVDCIDYRPNHTAYALFEGPELHVSSDGASEVLRPDVVVLATGVCERSLPFPGWTLPGVTYAGGAQSLLKAQGVRFGDRAVVAGAGPLPIAVAAQLAEAGVKVLTVALLHPWQHMLLHPYPLWCGRQVVKEGMQYLRILKKHDVEVISRIVPLRADGDRCLESVQLAEHDGAGWPLLGTEKRIDCDALAVNYGFTANSELAQMVGCELEYLAEQGGWLPVTDAICRTSVSGVLAAGDGACLRGAWVARAEGRIAGAAASCYYDDAVQARLAEELADAFRERRRHETFQRAVRQTLSIPAGAWSLAGEDTVVCRCECVPLSRVRQAVEDGHLSLNGIKRNTRAGMGWCGGRMCLQNVTAYLTAGRAPVDFRPMTPRPLARPVTLGSLRDQEDP